MCSTNTRVSRVAKKRQGKEYIIVEVVVVVLGMTGSHTHTHAHNPHAAERTRQRLKALMLMQVGGRRGGGRGSELGIEEWRVALSRTLRKGP